MRVNRGKLREGLISPPKKYGVNDIFWKKGIDYKELSDLPESVKWWISCMGFLRLLFVADQLSKEDEEICRFIIEDWNVKNPVESLVFPRAWDGHAVAIRSDVFIEVAKRSQDNNYLLKILDYHLDFLLDEKNFQGNWNHGVDQANSLIGLAEYLGVDNAKEVGARRLEEALNALVDDQGVTIEQSIHYQLYNYKQLGRCISVLRKAKKNKFLSSLIERRRKMTTFLAHATRPDGNYVEIGDTPAQKAESILNTDAEFAATLGSSGIAPLEKVKIYEAGYIFGRSGWGGRKRFGEESYYVIRFGPPRIVHGHNDHCSILYYTNGREILRDGGFHGYTDDSVRNFLRQIEAHNSISISNPISKFKGRETKLVSFQKNGLWQKFTLIGHPYEGVSHKRTIVFFSSPEVIVVVDDVLSNKEILVDQKWHFGDEIGFERVDEKSIKSDDGFFVIKQHYPFDKMSFFNKEDVENPSVVCGSKMYETQKSPLLITQRYGKKISFLTTFSFSSSAGIPDAIDRKVGFDGVRRSLSIFDERSQLKLLFLEGGEIAIDV